MSIAEDSCEVSEARPLQTGWPRCAPCAPLHTCVSRSFLCLTTNGFLFPAENMTCSYDIMEMFSVLLCSSFLAPFLHFVIRWIDTS